MLPLFLPHCCHVTDIAAAVDASAVVSATVRLLMPQSQTNITAIVTDLTSCLASEKVCAWSSSFLIFKIFVLFWPLQASS